MANEVEAVGGAGAAKGTDRLGTERIGRLLLEFSIPAIISMVFNSLYNVVDTAFLGQAFPDGTGVAVTTLALPVMTILMGFSMVAGQGGNALAAIQLGEGRKAQVEKTLGNSAVLLFGLAVLVAVAAVTAIDPILALIGTSNELWEPTKTFVQIICVGFAFQSLGMGLNNFLRTAGKPNLALGTMVFGVLVTVIYSIAADRMEEFTRSNIGVSMYVIIALLACVAAVLGIYGDLFASVVKRQCGIKDYGTIFPGHGGILDRFDSVMFIAPFVTMVVIAAFYN